jgi:acyl-CoA dehydrogenase
VIAPHPIGALDFDDVFVPAGQRVGAYGEGLKIALANLEVFRVTVGAAALGLADRALERDGAHLKSRRAIREAAGEQQGLQFALADVATDHVAAQLLVYRAAGRATRGAGRRSRRRWRRCSRPSRRSGPSIARCRASAGSA